MNKPDNDIIVPGISVSPPGFLLATVPKANKMKIEKIIKVYMGQLLVTLNGRKPPQRK
jgi:hypothetical protein